MADRGVVRRIAGRLWSAVKPQPRVRRIEQIAPEFATGPPVFRAPPLTPDLAAAIRLYCEQFDYPLTEAARALWETDQNAACRAEREALSPLLNAMPAPGKILDIGPGMGRSLVWFRREFPRAELHAWLATRENPGLMGAAIGRGDLKTDGPLCAAFLKWLEVLFA